MKQHRLSVPQDSIYPFLGLNTLDPESIVNPRYSPRCLNVDSTQGLVSKRRGYSLLGEEFVDQVIIGVIEFENLAGVRRLVCITTVGRFVHDFDSGEWADITGDTAWDGTADDWLDWIVGEDESGKFLYITNGKNLPQRWDGGAGPFEDLPTDIASFVTCRTFEILASRLVLGNVTTTTHSAQSIVWSIPGDFTDFTSEGSGEALLADAQGDIWKLLKLSDRVVIYSSDSIGSMLYVGGAQIFSFDQLVKDTRLVSGRSVVAVGPYHFFLSKENFYLFDGTRMIRTVGDVVHKTLQAELYADERIRAFGFHDAIKGQVLWAVPSGPDLSKVYVLEYNVYDLASLKWTLHSYADSPVCMGYCSRDTDITWDAPSISSWAWSDPDQRWNEGTTRGGFPARALASVTKVFLWDDAIGNDDGAPVASTWESLDFTVPQAYKSERGRWLEVELELRGGVVEVGVSGDSGGSWESETELVLSGGFERRKVLCDVSAERFRVKVRNVAGPWELRWLRAWVVDGGVA